MPQTGRPEAIGSGAIAKIKNSITRASSALARLERRARRIDSFLADDIKEEAELLESSTTNDIIGLRSSLSDKEREHRRTVANLTADHEDVVRRLQDEKKVVEDSLNQHRLWNQQLQRQVQLLQQRPTPQEPPPQQPRPSPRPPPQNSNRPGDVAIEANARASLDDGHVAFQQNDYGAAKSLYEQASRLIQQLSQRTQKTFDTSDIQYRRAVCTFHGSSKRTAANALADYIDAHTTSANADKAKLAHARKLLAQVYVKLGDLDEALIHGMEAHGLLLSIVPAEYEYYESAALLARIYQLKGHQNMATRYMDRVSSRYRTELTRKFESLGGQDDNPPPSRPDQPQPRPPPPTTPPGAENPHRSTPLATSTINAWLKELKIHNVCPIEDDILKGKVRIVSSAGPRDLKLALHIAALTDNIEIAQILINKDSSLLNAKCTTRSSSDSDNPGITPLHLAIAAQRHDMIRFLIGQGASLKVPSRDGSYTAPPRWLLGEAWLERMTSTGASGVVQTMETLLATGRWSVGADVNNDGKTMLDVAKIIKNRPETKRAAVAFLQANGGG